MAELFSIPSKAVIRHLPPFIWPFEMLTLGEISLCVRNLVTLRYQAVGNPKTDLWRDNGKEKIPSQPELV